MLAWGDSPTASTGFGVVNKNILKRLHQTNQFDIDILGINYFGDFYDQEKFPYQIVPAKLLDPADPYGNTQLVRTLQSGKQYDLLFIVNDIYVTHNIAKSPTGSLAEAIRSSNPSCKIVYYYPVDCNVIPGMTDMITLADIPVTYTQYGMLKTIAALPNIVKKLRVIPHGTDTISYFPMNNPEGRAAFRREYYGIQDDKTILLVNVARNSTRKDLARTILAFSHFRKKYPNSKLYLHTNIRDVMLDLSPVVQELNLRMDTDVIFPLNYSPANGFPDEFMNKLYNSADIFFSTHLGEGWGLPISEAQAAGTLVVVPNNSCMPELVGIEKGIMYPCKEQVYTDNSGLRPVGHMEDILTALFRAVELPPWEKERLTTQALAYTKSLTWDIVCNSWFKIFQEALLLNSNKNTKEIEGEIV
jgi:glycosyltransferase involved in cell wall biosynthesis